MIDQTRRGNRESSERRRRSKCEGTTSIICGVTDIHKVISKNVFQPAGGNRWVSTCQPGETRLCFKVTFRGFSAV